MRTIKFKAKRIDNGEWVEGDLITDTADGELCYLILPHDGSYDVTEHAYDVRNETVCQFTGLHDKDGREIWEGDILHLEPWKPVTVIWDSGITGFGLVGELADKYTVIGNIHDERTQNEMV